MSTVRLHKNWIYREQKPVPPELGGWASGLGVSPWLAAMLWERGLAGLADMDAYLTPGLKGLVPPKDWPGVADAAVCLA